MKNHKWFIICAGAATVIQFVVTIPMFMAVKKHFYEFHESSYWTYFSIQFLLGTLCLLIYALAGMVAGMLKSTD